jgi:P pilus assembly chaperone PapD
MHLRTMARGGFGAIHMLCLALWAGCGPASAQLLLSSSRLVYPVGARQVEMTITNDGQRLITAQAWVDADEIQARPEDTQAPFLVSPPVSKIQPGKSQTLRISYTGAPTTGDRETLYYLNILDIAPPPEKNAGANYMRMHVRSRFKVFYRPAGLAGDPVAAAKALVWKLTADGIPGGSQVSGGRAQLIADNPSPYFVSLVNVRLMRGSEVLRELPPAMASPFGQARLNVDNPHFEWRQATTVQYEFIDDYGSNRLTVSTLKIDG